MTDFVLNARNSTLRRVRLKPSLSSTSVLYSSSNCYLNSTPINNFVLPPPPPCAFSPPSLLSIAKSTGRTLKPSLRKLEPIGPESNATTAIIKSVHFNDPLTRVVHFYTPPPLDSTYDEDDEEETEEDEEEEEEEESKLEDAFLELYMINGLQDECDSLAIAQPPPTNNPLAINNNNTTNNGDLSLPNWPLTIHPARRFISQMVSLENLAWNHLLQVVQGRVLVHNLAFEKKVTVRCSFDDWETWTDIDAYYKESAFDGGGLSGVSSSNSAFDRFMFEIHVPNMHAFSCSMAVRYQTLGQEFWDNNNGNNFTAQSMPAGSTLGEKPLSFLKAIMQQEHDNNNNKEGLSIIPTFNLMEHHHDKDSNLQHHQERLKQSCRHGSSRDDIVSQQQQPAKTTTAKTRHLLDRFKFSKYGASRIPAAPVPTSKRSTMQQQQQQQKIETQLVVVDLSEQQTGNCNDALIRSSSIMDNHDEVVDLKETILYA